jgi:hypothetical protein
MFTADRQMLSVKLNNIPLLTTMPKYVHGMELYMHNPVS